MVYSLKGGNFFVITYGISVFTNLLLASFTKLEVASKMFCHYLLSFKAY